MPSLKQPKITRSHTQTFTHKHIHTHTAAIQMETFSAVGQGWIETVNRSWYGCASTLPPCKQCEDHWRQRRTRTHRSARLPLLLCCFLAAAAESSDWARRLSTSASAAFITISSSSCCCTRSSRDDRRSCTSNVLAAEILSSARKREIKVTFIVQMHNIEVLSDICKKVKSKALFFKNY